MANNVMTCPECAGTGRLEYTVAKPDPMAWRGGELGSEWDDCDICGGSGEIEIDENELEIDVIFENN